MDAKTLNQIIQKLDEELKTLDSKSENLLIHFETAAGICWAALNDLRKLVIKQGFQDIKEEIHFFRHIKPKINGKYIYYTQLFDIESHRHKASKKYQVRYLNNVLKIMHKYLEDNSQFCQYYWSNKDFMDEKYFLRDNSNYRINVNNYSALFDYKYSTAHDNTVSFINAYEQLTKYIDIEIDYLKYGEHRDKSAIVSNAKWTESTASLVELIYALHSSGAINNGNIEIHELAQTFEKMFNVKLDDYYRTFLDIKGRKKSKTKFLDKLIQDLLRKIDDADV